MDNTYYWLSARQRLRILMKAFVFAVLWCLFSFSIVIGFHCWMGDFFRDHPFFHLFFLISSFFLFAIAWKKEKISHVNIWLYRTLYALGVADILFWISLKIGITQLLIFFILALICFFLSGYVGLVYRPNITPVKIAVYYAKCLLCAIIIDFIAILFDIGACYAFSFAACIIFILYNTKEIQDYDAYLNVALQKKQISKPLPEWGFDMYINIIGMIFYPDLMRLLAKKLVFDKKSVS